MKRSLVLWEDKISGLLERKAACLPLKDLVTLKEKISDSFERKDSWPHLKDLVPLEENICGPFERIWLSQSPITPRNTLLPSGHHRRSPPLS